jgi:hypothetical protein
VGKMNEKRLVLVLFILIDLIICSASFSLGFILNRSKRSYDFNNVVFIPKTENPKYTFLEPEISDYICALCDGLKLDSDLVVAHLLVENPEFNPDAIHKNDNGTVDIGLFQLNDRYIWTEFREKYWFDNVELDPFNWKHNTYIALHLMADLHKEFKVQDDAIMAYNCGRGAVMNRIIKPVTYEYLRKVNNNYMLLKNCERENEKI